MSRAQLLYQLQSLDSEVDKLTQQLAEIAANLGESSALKAAKAAAELADKNLRQAQATMHDLNLEVTGLTEKIAAEEKALYGGKTLSAKEATNLQNEVAALKRRHNQREEHLLEAMVGVEEAEAGLKQAQSNLAAIQTDWAADQERLTHLQAALRQKLAELKEQRPVVVRAIDPDDLEEYEDLRLSKAGRAVALVKDGVCQGCGMAASSSRIQRARSDAELTYCGSCGRILYVA